MVSAQKITTFSWALSLSVVAVAFLAWAQGLEWEFSGLSLYDIFPLFGLSAFSLIWSQYVIAAARSLVKLPPSSLSTFFETISYVVLTAILLHPALLAFQLWKDGFGFPPQSYLQNYVAPGLKWVALLGTVSLFIFLAYELRRKFANRRWWKIIQYAGDAAVVAVFYHGLRLGGELQEGWYQKLWFAYGFVLAVVLIYSYWPKTKEETDL